METEQHMLQRLTLYDWKHDPPSDEHTCVSSPKFATAFESDTRISIDIFFVLNKEMDIGILGDWVVVVFRSFHL